MTEKQQQQFQQQNEEYDGDAGEYLALQSNVYLKLNSKYERMIAQLIELYSGFVRRGIGLKSTSFQKYESVFNEFDEEEFKKVPESLVEGLSGLMSSLFQVTGDAFKLLNSRDDSLVGAYDEVLLRLEKELRQSIKNEEKLKINLECMQVKQESLRKQVQRAEELADKLRLEVAAIKKDSQNKMRIKETEVIQLKKEKENARSMQRKLEAGKLSEEQQISSQIHSSKGRIGENYQNGSSSQMTSTQLDPERFAVLKNSLVKQSDESSNMEKKKLAQQVMQANKQKEMEGQKFSYEINRLRIQNEQKELENKKIKRSLDELHTELKKLKDELMVENMKKWSVEVSSEKNPHLVSFYKDKLEGKEHEIKGLKKSQKKFAILEKKLLVKEKAFEYERADYHEKLLYLDERVKKISKLYGDASQILKQPKYAYTSAVFLQQEASDQ